MATWTDLYIRATLSDQGNVPRSTAGISQSPDVIPYGIKPATDPVKYFTDNFNKDVGVNVVANQDNFLYLRGKNYYSGAQTGQAYLYWAKSSLLLYPAEWNKDSNMLPGPDGKKFINVSAAATGDVWVTPEAFKWKPEMPAPSYHYCLIGRISTTQNPNPIPTVGAIPDFAAWIAGNGGLGWRNVTTVDTGVAFSSNHSFTQGTTSDQMEVNLLCTGLPVGAEVMFTSDTNLPDGKGPISIPWTKITLPGGATQIFGTSAFIPAGWATTFSYSYKPNGGTPFPNFDLSIRVNYATTMAMGRLHELAWSLHELGYQEMMVWHRDKNSWVRAEEFYRSFGKTASENGDPVRLIVVGAFSSLGPKGL